MTKTRLEAFSDGVIAIIITIMVLELKVPHETSWEAVRPLVPVFLSYVLSFITVGIYWGNHHHLLHTITNVNSKIMWANMHLLFWLSLTPFATAWMGETEFDRVTVIVYAALLCFAGNAYYILLRVIENTHPHNEALKVSLSKQSRRGIGSMILYLLAIPAAFLHPFVSFGLCSLVLLVWFIPDRNIERSLKDSESPE